MQRWTAGVMAAVVVLGVSGPASARVAAPAGLAHRVATAEVVVVGKVEAIEDKSVNVGEAAYQVAGVKVEQGLFGAGDGGTVRVAFQPGNRRFPQLDLKPDQEAVFFLRKDPKVGVYVFDNYWDVLDKKGNADFEKDLETVKRLSRLLIDPAAGLKSKDAEDRFLTALMVLTRYRTDRGGSGKTEAVSAEESKALLKALDEGDWEKNDPRLLGYQMRPQTVFLNLGLTEKDGWKPLAFRDPAQVTEAAKKWLKDNADSYRVQKFVSK